MMHIGSGKRDEWEFEYTASKMAAARSAKERLRLESLRRIIRRFFPDGTKAASYFVEVEKKRGKASADRLRADCRVAWAKQGDELARAES